MHSDLDVQLQFCCPGFISLCLFRLCLSSSSLQGSRDNMSVVLVCLPGAPKVSEEAVKKEEELDKYLESRVEGQHMHNTHTEKSRKTRSDQSLTDLQASVSYIVNI